MPSEVRWGLLSTARIGRSIVRGIGLGAGSRVQAVASREWTRANEFAKELGIPRAFGSYDELLQSGEVDAIYNPLPNSMHSEWTIKSLEAGLPVLCEKPFAVNAAEARTMADRAQRANLPLAEAFMYRFHPVYDRILELIAEGGLGDLLSIGAVFCFRLAERDGNIRTSAELGGGALMDIGCYCVNLARRLAGCEPVRAFGCARTTTVDDTFAGLLEFPNGVLADFTCSIEAYNCRRAIIRGTTGTISLEDPWFPGEESARFMLCRGGDKETIETAGANCYNLEVDDFARACRSRTAPRWGADDAIANMTALDALRAAAKCGRAVEVAT